MGWLRLVGSLKGQVFFAKETYKRDYILQKKPTILRSLLIEATPYLNPVKRTLSSGTVPTAKVATTKLCFVVAGRECVCATTFATTKLCCFCHNKTLSHDKTLLWVMCITNDMRKGEGEMCVWRHVRCVGGEMCLRHMSLGEVRVLLRRHVWNARLSCTLLLYMCASFLLHLITRHVRKGDGMICIRRHVRCVEERWAYVTMWCSVVDE